MICQTCAHALQHVLQLLQLPVLQHVLQTPFAVWTAGVLPSGCMEQLSQLKLHQEAQPYIDSTLVHTHLGWSAKEWKNEIQWNTGTELICTCWDVMTRVLYFVLIIAPFRLTSKRIEYKSRWPIKLREDWSPLAYGYIRMDTVLECWKCTFVIICLEKDIACHLNEREYEMLRH